MKKYIKQLVLDMRDAASLAPSNPFENDDISREEAINVEMDDADRFKNGLTEKLSDIVGISRLLLPNPDMLNVSQANGLVHEMMNLLNAYNFIPEFPDELPILIQYQALYDIWDDKYVHITTGRVIIEFCDYDEENCPFPGYCKRCEEMYMDESFYTTKNILNETRDLPNEDGDSSFIPGIHNYCDNWCERCNFTNKCKVFKIQEEMDGVFDFPTNNEQEGGVNTPESEKFLDIDEESGYDELSDIENDEDLIDEFDDESDDFFSSDNKARRHPIVELAHEYSREALDWFRKWEVQMENGFVAQLAYGYADELMNAEEVMRWYHVFIYIKLKRALSGYYEIEEFEDVVYDMNGSAKVALIGIDNSIEAATLLARHLKQSRSEMKAFREKLEKIRFLTEKQFPDARNFIRPGFDEV